ncbi:CsbD family protein [Streptococcus pneumoniae]
MSVEEKLNQAKGSIKEGVGKAIGDEKMEKEGAAEKVVSKVKEVAEVAEDAKDAVEGAVEGVKNMLSGDDK